VSLVASDRERVARVCPTSRVEDFGTIQARYGCDLLADNLSQTALVVVFMASMRRRPIRPVQAGRHGSVWLCPADAEQSRRKI